MKAGILAGGKGIRLRKLFPSTHKSLIKIGGIPLIHRTIKILSQSGIDQVMIVIPKGDTSIRESFKQFSEGNVKLLFTEGKSINTITDFFLLQDFVSDEFFFVLMCDILFFKEDFFRFKSYCIEKIKSNEVSTAITNFVTSKNSISILCKNGLVVDMGREIEDKKWISAGIHYFPSAIFEYKEEYLKDGGTTITGFMRLLMRKGFKIFCFPFSVAIDMNTPYEYSLAIKYFSNII
jgi:choline kinase